VNLYAEVALFVSAGGLVGALYGAAFNTYIVSHEQTVIESEPTPTAIVVPMAVVPVAPVLTTTPRPTVPPPSRAPALSVVPGVSRTPSPSAVP
jgi:hypothetical protein